MTRIESEPELVESRWGGRPIWIMTRDCHLIDVVRPRRSEGWKARCRTCDWRAGPGDRAEIRDRADGHLIFTHMVKGRRCRLAHCPANRAIDRQPAEPPERRPVQLATRLLRERLRHLGQLPPELMETV